MQRKILLKSIPQAYKFHEIVQGFMKKVDLKQSHYVVDGKSLMGIFSLDLSEPLFVCTEEVDDEIADCLLEQFKFREV